MNYFRLYSLIGVGLILVSPAFPQSSPKPKTQNDNRSRNDKSVAKVEADRIRKERQTQARSLLISLAIDVRSFRDQTLRARSLARIADALWDMDAEQGRTLFRSAWEAAAIADKESKETVRLRRQVLAVIARRDAPLAEEFLQKLKADQELSNSEDSKSSLWEPTEELQERLSLAEALLRTGDIEGALRFAAPALVSVTISSMDFLTQLREKDPAVADQRYAALLASTGGNMLADANTISLLSSYIFTPQTYVVFNHQGGADTSWMPSSFPPANVSPQLRQSFFQIAAGILLRPQLPPDQDRSSTGIIGKYMVVKRLLPIFELYAPQSITAAIRNQYEALSSLVSEELRQKQDEALQRGIGSEKSLTEQEESLRDEIERARTSSERDELYFKLALFALNKEDLKARDYVSKIDESEFRRRAQAWVDWGLALRAVKKKDIDKALELGRKGEVSHIQRVWIFTQSAKVLAKTDRERALSLVDEAAVEVRRLESAEDRPGALLAIANATRLIEPSRVWDALFDAVKAANSVDGFVGEGGMLIFTVRSKSKFLTSRESVSDFDVRGIFGEVANQDYERAIELARAFQGEATRANATIAICRSVLNEKKAATPAPTPLRRS
ncbi:MAG TPA: hypothetical protein VJT15_17140 [Pyrinomonadaceae bacterium]|nr:hypothetical protein [Pyrinomonadaceae bacterium]